MSAAAKLGNNKLERKALKRVFDYIAHRDQEIFLNTIAEEVEAGLA